MHDMMCDASIYHAPVLYKLLLQSKAACPVSICMNMAGCADPFVTRQLWAYLCNYLGVAATCTIKCCLFW